MAYKIKSFGSGINLKNEFFEEKEDEQVRKTLSKLPKHILKEYGLISLKKELDKKSK